MTLKQVQKFDKLIQKTTDKKLKTFDEIANIILNLIKVEVNTNQNELMQRVSENATFGSADEIQSFLNGYFEFHNLLIQELESLEVVENDLEFDKKIKLFVTNLLSTLPKERLKESVAEFIEKIIDIVMSEFPIEKSLANNDGIEGLVKIFASEDVAMMFMGLTMLSKKMRSDKMSSEEVFEHASSSFIFCMAMNSLRKDDYHNAITQQTTTQDSANSISYNVGRNDPCPCGSGRKYKKCCMNRDKPQTLQIGKFEEPQDILAPLTALEMHKFYSIWTMFLNFVSMTYAGVAKEEYIEIYDVNDKGEYYLRGEAMDTLHYITIRNFLNEYFFMLVDHFIDDNGERVDEDEIDMLLEARDTYKNIDAISYEMFSNGNAIFYDLDNQNCFYAYKSFYDYSKVFPKAKTLQAMFFSYKGRIITDGVAATPRIEIGSNMQDMMIKDYEDLRKNLKYQLDFNQKPEKTVYQLKISIKGAKPPIWRRVLVKPTITFKELHQNIQDLFEWDDSHLYMFRAMRANYVDIESMGDDMFGDSGELESNMYSIERELSDIKDKITYVYDFGDDWKHEIVLEKILPLDETIDYPKCTGGRRAAPLEDCGGIYRYHDIVEAIENPTFENQYILDGYEEEWYKDFVPSEFDKEEINSYLREDDWE
ncbi:MAG: SEC-C metal-binding domain-containing protein [Campylobacterota bacterium]|nr:SEC-C metal-binding domain-containing protein [Campylobacterota bacterium]